MSRSVSVVALGTVLWLLNVSSLLADDPPAAARQIRTGQAAIEEELAKPIVLEFIDTPLSDVIDFLKDHCKIEIQLDNRALTDVGIGSDTPVKTNLHALPLRSALNLMLRQLNLAWTVRDDVLFITTPEEAESTMVTKVYDVVELVVCRDKEGELWDDYDQLIEMITSTITPTSWDAVGGPGSIAPANCGHAKALVIMQTYEIQGRVAELFARIREVSKKSFDKELPQRERRQPVKNFGPSLGDGSDGSSKESK